jgi:LysR family transcriptional regulator, mexEF-oprN operon transcriptional activator
MNEIDLRSIDLNLLKAFEAMDRERNVTAAATRLGIGQPAMSHALQRLRDLLDDPLYVRGPGGMAPTPRALELIAPIKDALARIEEALRGNTLFDPFKSTRRFRIGMSDLVAAAVVPSLVEALRLQAPNADLAVRNVDRTNAVRMLDDNDIDLAIGLFPAVPEWHQKEDLFEEDFACVFNKNLIKLKTPVTMKQYLAHSHILTTLQGDDTGFVDQVLSKQNLKRRVHITSPFFLLSGYLLHQLPLIATLPRHYAELCAKTSDLTISALPFPTPSFKISMVWHRRDASIPISQFIRRLVVETTKRS